MDRREFAKLSAMATGSLTLPWSHRELRAAILGGTLDPNAVDKYVLPLVKPPAMPLSKGTNKKKDTQRRFRWPKIATTITAVAVLTNGCASGGRLAGSDPSGEGRLGAKELDARTQITWVLHNTNWDPYQVAAMIGGTTRYQLGIVDGSSTRVLRWKAPFSTGRVIVFELTNRVDGGVVRMEPREVAPGCRVLLTIQPFATQSTLLVDFGGR